MNAPYVRDNSRDRPGFTPTPLWICLRLPMQPDSRGSGKSRRRVNSGTASNKGRLAGVAEATSVQFETPSARLRLAIKSKPYPAVKIMRGLEMLYRRNQGPGMWIARVCSNGKDWARKLAFADDRDPANGRDILDHRQAIDECKQVADAGKLTADNTVRAALDTYKADLKDRGKDPENVVRFALFGFMFAKSSSR
jgi:hypothetical protein